MRKIEEITRDELLVAIDGANSVFEVLTKLRRATGSGNYSSLRSRADELEITLPYNRGSNLKEVAARKRLPDDVFFTQGVLRAGVKLRKRMLALGVPYSCSNSSCRDFRVENPIVAGAPLVLQVEHKDGDRLNNLLSNLCFLCPNCHSQTPTYGGKGKALKARLANKPG